MQGRSGVSSPWWQITLPCVLAVILASAIGLAGCAPEGTSEDDTTSQDGVNTSAPVPLDEDSYYVDATLGEWIDPETGYDTTREWTLEGGEWPVALIMSPSQSPQLLVAERDGMLSEALGPLGIDPVVERIDLPPRTFHALQRSKWPFAYMPLAVFTDYARSNDNQGGAGGLQYVAIAGSTAGGGYTLITMDDSIRTVADLTDKTVAQVNSNPVPGTLLASAARQAGLELGDGEGQIHLARGPGGDQLNAYEAGEVDAAIILNILKPVMLGRGSHVLTDFADVEYTPNYTVLCVERSVLEERPEVVEAFLEMHYQADQAAVAEWDASLQPVLLDSWNTYFESQTAESAAQRIVADWSGYEAILGEMYPEDRLDPRLLADCLEFVDDAGLWGWAGAVDTSRLSALELYDAVLESHGEPSQADGTVR